MALQDNMAIRMTTDHGYGAAHRALSRSEPYLRLESSRGCPCQRWVTFVRIPMFEDRKHQRMEEVFDYVIS